MRSRVTKDLHSPKYRQRVKEDAKKKQQNKPIDVQKLTHLDLVNLIQEKEDDS